MEDIVNEITSFSGIVLVANFLLFLIIFFITLSNRAKIKKMKKKYVKFMNGLSDRNIEELLDTCIDDLNKVKDRHKEIENHINHIDRNLIQCIQKVGIVRFNAFDNVGSDLSFSIALLDNNDSGIVISGIYSRDSSATYAKPVANGKSKYPLSAEEMQAYDQAKKSHGERLYMDKQSVL